MPTIVTQQFKIDNAKNFMAQFTTPNTNSLYMFLAKATPWNTDFEIPPDPQDNSQNYFKLWDEILAMKRINFTDMSHVVRRINWTKNTVYSEYDNLDNDLFSKDFFVLNSEFNVYKCIDNASNSESLVEPTGKSLNIFSTADGYKWKYLYTLDVSDRLKFLTANWMPVKTDPAVSAVAKDGAIEHVKIFNGGTDYSIRANLYISGDGTGANIGFRQNLGVIYEPIYYDNGTRYRFANTFVTDSNSRGRGANVRAILSPIGGHGSDTIRELGAKYVMLYTKTEYNEGFGDFPGGFSYRKLGIIKNPKTSSNAIANVSSLTALEGLVLANVIGTFSAGEYVEGVSSNANAYIVSTTATDGNGRIRYSQVEGVTNNFISFTVGENLIGKSSGATAQITTKLASNISQDTGEILYVENRYAVTRVPSQTDTLHLVLEF